MIYLPDSLYNPNFIDVNSLTPSTKLAPGVTLGMFLGSSGNKMALRNIQNPIAKRQILRNLYLHAQVITFLNHIRDGERDLFPTVNVVVSEGLYTHQSIRPISGENIKKSDGRLIVYQVINVETGRIDHDKTFDVAEFLKDYFHFEKISLEYDTYNVDGTLTSQIVIEMPNVPESFDIDFSYTVDTVYNGNVLSRNELIEIMPPEDEECTPLWEKEEEYLSSGTAKYGDWPDPKDYTGKNGNLPLSELRSIGGGHLLHKDIIDDYNAMKNAAAAEDIYWGVTEAYRDYKEQVRLAIKYGLYSENKKRGIKGGAAYPGTSKHGFGLGIDLNSNVGGRWAPGAGLKVNDKAYIWLKKNSLQYGFKTIPNEPWHWEYFRKTL